MTISIRLSTKDTLLIKKYVAMKNETVSDLVRESVLSRIEDEFDLKAYEDALAEYHKNPVTYSLDEVEKKFGLR
jgi:RHH-type rel operon transcriptional repressor/antitoxin RelB